MPTVPEVTRIALKNILFPTDFSPTSSAALPFAQALAHIYGATILVTHVLPSGAASGGVTDRLPAQDDRPLEDANQKLAELTHSPVFNGIRCKAFLGRGDLATVIPAVIQEHDVDLVVLGTHGRRGVTKLVLGSDAEKIYRSATCPVLTVGPKARAPQRSADWKLRHILCPVDVSEDPEPVLHYALSLAEENEAEIVIMEAIPMVPWQHRAAVEQRALRGLQSLIPSRQGLVHTRVCHSLGSSRGGNSARGRRASSRPDCHERAQSARVGVVVAFAVAGCV